MEENEDRQQDVPNLETWVLTAFGALWVIVGGFIVFSMIFHLKPSLCPDNSPDAPPALWSRACGYIQIGPDPITLQHADQAYIAYVNEDGYAELLGEGFSHIQGEGFLQVSITRSLPTDTERSDLPTNVTVDVEFIKTDGEAAWYFQRHNGIWYFRYDLSWEVIST